MDEDGSGKQNRRLIKVYRFAIYATYVRVATSAILGFVASALLFALDPAKFMSVLKNDYISYLFAVNYTFYFMVMVYVIIGAVVFMVSATIMTRNLVQQFIIDLAAEKTLGLDKEQ